MSRSEERSKSGSRNAYVSWVSGVSHSASCSPRAQRLSATTIHVDRALSGLAVVS